ncbi:unnamed protein product [Linum trigynum]|uniref:ADP-ribosyl cyclase/cyclic ADP-ribose hydrolase n=1 Tax=Linum trigynum TaxID=586398 RepID=A0AAV2DTV2_9ROSI
MAIPPVLLLFLVFDPVTTHGFRHCGSSLNYNNPGRAAAVPLITTPWRHHVFLNFRGPDVRHTFADHLYYALVRKGIKAFRDDSDLPRGQSVAEAIPRAIEESKLSVVVLSRGYASSEYCLDELVKIMQTVKEKGHQAFPVFYRLTPDDVVDHMWSGCYKDDFDRHKRVYSYERVDSWSHALTDIADIAGWVLPSDRSEAVMVERIAENMASKVHELGPASSSVTSDATVGFCGTDNVGGKLLQHDDTTGQPTRPPPPASENIDRGHFVPPFRPEQFAGDDTTTSPLSSKTCRASNESDHTEPRSSTIPAVRVRLVGVPVEYMNAQGLSYIASVIGKPMYMTTRLSEEGITNIVVALGDDQDEKDGGGVAAAAVVVKVFFYQWRPCRGFD